MNTITEFEMNDERDVVENIEKEESLNKVPKTADSADQPLESTAKPPSHQDSIASSVSSSNLVEPVKPSVPSEKPASRSRLSFFGWPVKKSEPLPALRSITVPASNAPDGPSSQMPPKSETRKSVDLRSFFQKNSEEKQSKGFFSTLFSRAGSSKESGSPQQEPAVESAASQPDPSASLKRRWTVPKFLNYSRPVGGGRKTSNEQSSECLEGDHEQTLTDELTSK